LPRALQVPEHGPDWAADDHRGDKAMTGVRVLGCKPLLVVRATAAAHDW
jgi:hypothetical protein